jgi:ubiquinol-cytochrome c reductase cytochrome b subunit
MRILKSSLLFIFVNNYLVDAIQPINLNFWWNIGSLLALCLIIQIITGLFLAMHYNSDINKAFDSVEHIMRDVNNGWLIRYTHSNTASVFFFLVYLHIGRGLYYRSYKYPRTITWIIGTIIFILMIVTAFLGYVLPFGQMSLWGATVITNLMSAIPWLGQDIVEFIWGGFSVSNATLTRFFALHFLLPFILSGLALLHLITLHKTAGSSNPSGFASFYDGVTFSPYYIFKDLITIHGFIILETLLIFFMPNLLGDCENYVMANPMQTPSAIVPEWYLLPFYAILRSIPNKLSGVLGMLGSLLILFVLNFLDGHKNMFNIFRKTLFFWFIVVFILLGLIGQNHVEYPFVEMGQINTFIYFFYFLGIIPILSIIDNIIINIKKTT